MDLLSLIFLATVLVAPNTVEAVQLPPIAVVEERAASPEIPPVDPIASNCYRYVAQHVKLPLMAEIKPNTTPAKGVVAVFQYPTLKHIALVDSIAETGFWVSECNYRAGKCGKRFVPWGNYALKGFFTPTTSTVAPPN